MLDGVFMGTALGLLMLMGDRGIDAMTQATSRPFRHRMQVEIQDAGINVDPAIRGEAPALPFVWIERAPRDAVFMIAGADSLGRDAQLLHPLRRVTVEHVHRAPAEIDGVFGRDW